MAGRGEMVREIIYEFMAIGGSVRVSALDPETLVEVVITGPASAGQAALEQVARAKLERAVRGARSR